MGGGRWGNGRWEGRGWEVGERGEGSGREESGRKYYSHVKKNVDVDFMSMFLFAFD